MSSYFEGKVFLVTGASSGIGKALALELNRRGAKVAMMARRKEKLEEIQSESGAESLLVSPGDVSVETDCRRVVENALKTFGGLDGLIHNAGVSQRSLAAESKVEIYHSLMGINFFSMVYLFKYARESIVERKGHIVSVSSMMGKYSTQLRSGYAASKHALVGYMDSIRLELSPEGVHVMTSIPGFVNTDIAINSLGGDGRKHGIRDSLNAAGLPPLKVARDILSGMEARKREIISAGFTEKLGLFLSKQAPGLLDRMLLKRPVN